MYDEAILSAVRVSKLEGENLPSCFDEFFTDNWALGYAASIFLEDLNRFMVENTKEERTIEALSGLLIEAMGAPWGMDMDSEEKAFYASHSSLQGAVAMMAHCEHWEGDLLIRHLDV